jgi:hypothetical protein
MIDDASWWFLGAISAVKTVKALILVWFDCDMDRAQLHGKSSICTRLSRLAVNVKRHDKQKDRYAFPKIDELFSRCPHIPCQ